VAIAGRELPGLGNPRYANIRVHSFNPDVDVPNVCAMCSDTPCVKACPVEPEKNPAMSQAYEMGKNGKIGKPVFPGQHKQ
jgi:anaerobic carbon-monoxide dehydrogenase iron sulfur subunit